MKRHVAAPDLAAVKCAAHLGDDVADLITYLCREESGYITGVTYDVNGGAHIH